MPKNFIAPIPDRWSRHVIKLLEKGDTSAINWTLAAKKEIRPLGFATEQCVFDWCCKTLLTPNLIGECVTDMRTIQENHRCETWAFLCPHPLNGTNPIYAKIGLHETQITIDLFSIHIDRTGDLQDRINNYLDKK